MPYVPLIKRISDHRKSPVRKYQDLFVGSNDLASLIRYEAVTSLLGSFPGALGIYLRMKVYPWLLKACGKSVFFGRGVSIRVPKRIELGYNIIIDDNTVLDAKGDPGISFIKCGNDVEIGRNTILSCKGGGSISVGNFVSIGRNVLLSAVNQLTIADNCSVGPYSCLLASGHGWNDPEQPIMLQGRDIKKIVLEENVWLGAHVTILDGVTVGRNSIVAAGSVVTDDIPPYRIAGGTPARIIAKRDQLGPEDRPGVVHTSNGDGKRVPHGGPTTREPDQADRVPASQDLHQRATQAVLRAVAEVNEQLPSGRRLDSALDTALFDGGGGGAGRLDSLGLLNLIVATEQQIEAEFGTTVTLADEGAMSQQHSPFRTIGTLAAYVSLVLEKSR
jgi:acetyltransferase-like isoleucine patch superfamily enzyme